MREREVFSPFDGSEDVAALSPEIEQSFVGGGETGCIFHLQREDR